MADALAILMGKGKKAPESSSDMSSDAEDAAQDVLDAMKSSDAKALNLALKRHYAACEGKEEEAEDEDEDTAEA